MVFLSDHCHIMATEKIRNMRTQSPDPQILRITSEPESELALIYDARGTGIDRHVGAAPEAREILRPKSVTVNPIARGLELHPTPKNVDK